MGKLSNTLILVLFAAVAKSATRMVKFTDQYMLLYKKWPEFYDTGREAIIKEFRKERQTMFHRIRLLFLSVAIRYTLFR